MDTVKSLTIVGKCRLLLLDMVALTWTATEAGLNAMRTETNWKPNNGKVTDDVFVEYRCADGYVGRKHAFHLRWDKQGNVGDIVEYRILEEYK
tara:strand:+ start:3109 stop:3387 length:279 start_codon:yes stop_codon:yes gene_type:complete